MITEPNRTEEVFSAALQRKPGAERAAYLDGICAGDPVLRERVEALLGANEAAGDFLKQAVLTGEPTLDGSGLVESPGCVVGRYKLLERIGEGGMAVVYMAEQQEPIRRKVALKIIKLGMDTRQVIARFEAERQTLSWNWSAADPSPNTATRTGWIRADAWSFSLRSAGRSSTPTRKALSIATSSRPTLWSRYTTTGRSPR